MAKTTATQRTLKYLRERGFLVEVVEKWVRFGAAKAPEGSNTPGKKSPGIRRDLFGFADLIAVRPGWGILAVQTFTTDWTGHVEKLQGADVAPNADAWLRACGGIYLIGWRKLKPKGAKRPVWTPRIGRVFLTYPDRKLGIHETTEAELDPSIPF